MNGTSTGQLSLFDPHVLSNLGSALAAILQSTSTPPSSGVVTTTPGPTRTDAWQNIFNRIRRFTDLEPDWDSYGGRSPRRTTCARTITLAATWRALAQQEGEDLPEPMASPCGNGSIQMEWTIGRRRLEIEVSEDLSHPYTWVAIQSNTPQTTYFEGEFYKVDGPQALRSLRWLITEK